MTAADSLERDGGAAEIRRPSECEVAEVGADLIRRLLQSLGRTADEIAESLRQAGIRGVRGAACRCPIYEWLDRALDRHAPSGTCMFIDQVGGMIEFRVHRCGDDYAWGSMNVSTPVREFITAFDEGAYPDLEVKK